MAIFEDIVAIKPKPELVNWCGLWWATVLLAKPGVFYFQLESRHYSGFIE